MEEDKSLTSEEGQVETEDESTVDTETKTEEHKQEKIEPEKGDNQEILFYVDTMPNNGEENKNQEIKVEVVKNEEDCLATAHRTSNLLAVGKKNC